MGARSQQLAIGHVPVMLGEVIETLAPQDGHIYVDGTFGAGGYTRAILNAADCKVYALDRDPEAYLRAQNMAHEFPGRLIPVHGRFGSVAELLDAEGVRKIDGLVLDIGVSSIQLSTAARGFSFQHDGPLDMRMSRDGLSAADVVNTYEEAEIADILYTYGEEHASRRIARAIVAARATQPITTTLQLANVVHDVMPRHGKTDSATKTFQALRIFVNDELGELDRALHAAEQLIAPSGRLVVVSFHSLEDWRVKTFFKTRGGKMGNASRHLPPSLNETAAAFGGIDDMKPSDEEIAQNPRSRSARLRYGIRTEVSCA